VTHTNPTLLSPIVSLSLLGNHEEESRTGLSGRGAAVGIGTFAGIFFFLNPPIWVLAIQIDALPAIVNDEKPRQHTSLGKFIYSMPDTDWFYG
jgi:hypothetical protein